MCAIKCPGRYAEDDGGERRREEREREKKPSVASMVRITTRYRRRFEMGNTVAHTNVHTAPLANHIPAPINGVSRKMRYEARVAQLVWCRILHASRGRPLRAFLVYMLRGRLPGGDCVFLGVLLLFLVLLGFVFVLRMFVFGFLTGWDPWHTPSSCQVGTNR